MFTSLWLAGALWSSAEAGTYTLEQATADVAELAPRVSEAAGRPLLDVPPVQIMRHAEVLKRAPGFHGTPSGSLLGVYVAEDHLVYLVEEGIASVVAAVRPSASDRDAVLRAEARHVLAHELVHAIQFQWAPPSRPLPVEQELEGWRILSEGQAEWVASAVAPSPLDDLDVLSRDQMVDDNDLYGRRYIVGPLVADLVVDRFGVDALWSLLAAPRSADTLLALGQAKQAGGWGDFTLLDGMLRSLGATPGRARRGAVLTSGIARDLCGLRSETESLALAFKAHIESGLVQGFGMSFDAPGVAHEALVQREARVKEARGMRGLRMLAIGARINANRMTRYRPGGRARELAVDELLILRSQASNGDVYKELWARRGATVLLIGSFVGELSQAREDAAIRAFLDHPPSSQRSPEQVQQLEARLAALAPTTPAPEHPDADAYVFVVAPHLRVSDPRRCLALGATVQTSDAELAGLVAGAAHACAVEARVVAEADAWRARAPDDSWLLSDARIRHAKLLGASRRAEDGLAMLGVGWPPEERFARDWGTARLGLLMQAGRRAEVEALAKDPRPQPDVRLAAAAWLEHAGRAEAAAAIRRAVCGGPPETVPPVCAAAG